MEILKQKIIQRLNSLTKPIKSLGYLEEIALKIGLIQEKVIPDLFKDKRVYVFAGDHGVVEEGVSAYPKEVTAQMVYNFLKGGAAINVFSRHVNAKVFVVDAGVDHDFEDHPFLIKAKIGYGTRNFTKGPAMNYDKAELSLKKGREIARNAVKDGGDLLAVGDMGIGNTTTATAIAVAFGYEIDKILDIGTVIDERGLERKKNAIIKGMEVNKPNPADPVDVLSKVGSYCLGEMAGFILEACESKVPVVIDGFPTTAAYLLAYKINPIVKDYAFAGHKSSAKGHEILLKDLGLRPILDLDMRLGEGTGAVLSMSIIEAAVKMIREMATFEEASVSKGKEKI